MKQFLNSDQHSLASLNSHKGNLLRNILNILLLKEKGFEQQYNSQTKPNVSFKKTETIFLVFAFLFLLGGMERCWGQTPVPMSSQVGLTYTENFADIANWTNNFASGIGALRWASYPITAGGTANDGKRTTKSSATFVTSTSGGVQKGTGNFVFLSTGSGSPSEAVAVDFLLDFTSVNAGTLSFNWATIDNASGTRPTSLRVFWSTDNAIFTEITAAQIIDVQSPASGTITTVALPASFNNSATARLRFYNHAGIVTGAGNRDKISIDDVTVTATAATMPLVTAPTVASITSSTAILGGNVTSDGGSTITARGVVWSVTATNASPTIGGTGTTNVVGSGTTGVFTISASGLPPNTQISYCAYAVNGVGTSYTTAATFTTLIAASLTPPALTAAAGATADAAFNVTFIDDAAWRAAITGIIVDAVPLTAGSAVTSGQITFTPSASVPASLLQFSGIKSIVVIATGYNDATISQPIGPGADNKLAMNIQPTAPTSNGGALAVQPSLFIQDQYGNATASTALVTANTGSGVWTPTGNITANGVSGTATFSGLTATSAAAVTGATINFTSPGLIPIVSNAFNIPAPIIPADHIVFINVPSYGSTNVNMNIFTVQALRPDNSIDNTFTGNIIITKASGSGNLTGTTTKTAIAGVAIFNDLQFDAEDIYTLNANSGSFSQITSGSILIKTPIARWSFDGVTTTNTGISPIVSAGSVVADAGAQTAGSDFSGVHTNASTAWSNPAGNGSLKSVSSNNWAVGNYFQFHVDLTGYYNISLIFDQFGSATGPANFKLQYSTNGSSFSDFPGNTYSIPSSNSWTTTSYFSQYTFTFDLSTLTSLNGISTAYFRLFDNSTTAINGATVAAAGTGRIDNFTVNGTLCVPPSPPVITSTESYCQPGCILIPGSFNIVTTCGAGSTLTYFTDGTGTTTAGVPIYNQASPMTIYYACVDNVSASCRSAIQTLTTVPSPCINPSVDAGPDTIHICAGSPVSLNGTITGEPASVTWTAGFFADGTFGNPNALITTYTPGSSDISSGQVTLTLTSNPFGGCPSSTDNIVVIIDAPPLIANLGSNFPLCPNDITVFDVEVYGGATSVTFTGSLGLSNFQNSYPDFFADYTPTTGEGGSIVTITATTNTNGVCPASFIQYNVTVNNTPFGSISASAATVCSGTSVDLIFTATTGTGPFDIDINGNIYNNISSGSVFTTVTPLINTTYILYAITDLGITPGCSNYLPNSNVLVTVIQTDTVDAGPATTHVCAGSTVSLNGTMTGGPASVTWTADFFADGFFGNPNALVTTYTPGSSDISAGQVTLILASDPFGVCPSSSDSVVVIIDSPPLIANLGSNFSLCPNDITNFDVEVYGGATSVTFTGSPGLSNFQNSYPDFFADYTPLAGESGSIVTITATTNSNACPASSIQYHVTVNHTPFGSISASAATVCSGTSIDLTFTATTGTGPFDIDINGTIYNNITSGSVFTTVTPLINTTYILYAITDLGITPGCSNYLPNSNVLVTVNPTYNNNFDTSACNSFTFPWGGSVNVSDSSSHIYTSVNGCDSVVTINVTINQSSTSNTNVTVCSNELPYTWNGNDYSAAGSHEVTFPYGNAAGCDSVATLNLTINQTSTSSTNVSVCSNELPYTWNGSDYSTAGPHDVTFPHGNAVGCDSIATLILTIGNPTSSAFYVTSCMPYILPWGDVASISGDYTHHYPGYNGCDSVVTAHVTIGCVTLSVRMFIEGYYTGGGLMNNSGAGGCLYINNISADSLDADTVFISAMSSSYPYGQVDRQMGILRTNGMVTVTFGNAVAAGLFYYIRVQHRNSMETWSTSAESLNTVTSYDFSNSITKAYGNNMIDIGTPFGDPPTWAFYSGDISDAVTFTVGVQDGIIESQDYGDMENAVNLILTGYVTEDITGDGIVESADYSIMQNNVNAIIFSNHP